jgi:hypothetical protein
VYALQTQHGSRGLVTIGNSGGGQKVYTQCMDLGQGEYITRVGVNAGKAGLTTIKLYTNRRNTVLGDTAQCSGFRKACVAVLCRRRLLATIPVLWISEQAFRRWRYDGGCPFAEPPEGAAFAAGFKVYTDKQQRVAGLQVHWGVPA